MEKRRAIKGNKRNEKQSRGQIAGILLLSDASFRDRSQGVCPMPGPEFAIPLS
jgi:hypothetical protein